MCKINGNGTTLENIHRAAKAEFLEKGYKDASLRNIVKSVGMTTGAFYGYYKSKEELFEAKMCIRDRRMSDLKGIEYKRFEDIKHIREDGSEYWSARELGPALA